MDRIGMLPKVDLHLHLDGSVRPATLLDIAASEGIPMPAWDAEKLGAYLQVGEECRSLPEYLGKFELPLRCMQSSSALERIAGELVEDAARDQVHYVEIRFAPALHTERGLSYEEVIAAVWDGAQRSSKLSGTVVRLIVICMRHHSEKVNLSVLEAAKAFLGQGVAAIDLAGDEVHYPPELHRRLFQQARSAGFPVTLHAGEAAGAEHIREAVENMGACRIGHGVRLREDRELLQVLIDRRIPLEMCVTSNIQTKAVDKPEKHPIREYYDQGVMVTLNTDNTTVSATTMSKETRRAMSWYGFTEQDIAVMTMNALKVSFVEEPLKVKLLADYHNRFRQLGIQVS